MYSRLWKVEPMASLETSSVVPTPAGRPETGGPAGAPGLTKKEQRRVSVDRLLAAALRLFITQGYHATSVEEIAGAAGLTKGAVYFYFKSKSRVLVELLDRVEAATIAPTIRAVDAAGADPRDRLVAFMHAQSLAGAERAELMMLAILMATEFHGSGDPIERRIEDLMGRLYGLVEDIVAAGRASGAFRADLGLRETASLLMAVNQGCFVEWYRRGRELDGPDFVRAMRSIVLEGVSAPPK
jgi:AcrR family transcriptional regulator